MYLVTEMSKPENRLAIKWTELHIPSVWASKFQIIAERLDKVCESIEGARDKKYCEHTIKLYRELVLNMEEAYKPRPPKTLQDSYDYAKSRKYKGTFMALLDADGNLVKTVIVKRGSILPAIPEYTIEDTKIQVEMTQHLLKIPDLDIERVIPKRAVKVIPFGSDKEKIIGYGTK